MASKIPIQANVAFILASVGLTAERLCKRIDHCLGKWRATAVAHDKSITPNTLRNWLNGKSNPNPSKVWPLALYYLYGEQLAEMKPDEVDQQLVSNTVSSILHNDISSDQTMFAEEHAFLADEQYYLYSLFSPAIEMEPSGPDGMIGYFVVSSSEEGSSRISKGFVCHVFKTDGITSLVQRGNWSSSNFHSNNENILFRFLMRNDLSMSQYDEGGYEGYIDMNISSSDDLIVGKCSFRGLFQDLSEYRIQYRGNIYCELVSAKEVELKSMELHAEDFIARARSLI
ncbi:MAG: hypothetical protein JJ908_14045 [Rhizobiales bacterium]|nr:hypothetical protein [Hyphomicrobiales bacterium]MBO6700349.1 hypothetical protein [Hyphomicrobiales bacterium]MBO6737487.1 hypothetical protein [Hyphomicrobiales bacterium]MBO6913456.1 hypothetical protein [Hyphomicrobiales bacterium]MBO6955387.1 hypothetical protein [Hyphomicrobiales bacterium]